METIRYKRVIGSKIHHISIQNMRIYLFMPHQTIKMATGLSLYLLFSGSGGIAPFYILSPGENFLIGPLLLYLDVFISL